MDEVIDALTEDAFSGNDQPRYAWDGAARLRAHLRALTGRADLVVSLADLQVAGVDASSASAGRWAVVRQLRRPSPTRT